MTSHARTSSVMAICLVTACASGSSASYAYAPSGTVTRETTEAWERIEGDGTAIPLGCALVDNRWNEVHAVGSHLQRVFVETLAGGEPAFGWQWAWSSSGDVVAYPELVCGTKPWDLADAPYPPGGTFPLRAGSAGLNVEFDLQLQASGIHNTSFSLWAVSDPSTPRQTISNEIMIWVENGGMTPAGTWRGTAQASGTRFDLYVLEDQYDHSGGTSARWTYAAYVARTPLGGALDLTPLLADLIARGFLSADAYLGDLELGNEVIQGSGLMELRRFSLSVTPPPG